MSKMLNKKATLISVLLFVAVSSFFAGFALGRKDVGKIKSVFEEERKDNEGEISKLTRELYAAKYGLGFLSETKRETYSKELFEVYSPLLLNKEVDVSIYKFKGATIVNKRLSIDDNSGIEIWQYDSEVTLPDSDLLEDFVVFGGYENYANHPTSVNELKKGWQDLYRTKSGVGMYYSYEFTPKSIGVVSLNSYHKYFSYRNPKPSVLRVWYRIVGGMPISENDPLVLDAENKVNNIADAIEILTP